MKKLRMHLLPRRPQYEIADLKFNKINTEGENNVKAFKYL